MAMRSGVRQSSCCLYMTYKEAIAGLSADVFSCQSDLVMQVRQIALNGFPDDVKVHFVITMRQYVAHVIGK